MKKSFEIKQEKKEKHVHWQGEVVSKYFYIF